MMSTNAVIAPAARGVPPSAGDLLAADEVAALIRAGIARRGDA
mgnify:CR=1 FL=1